MNSENHIIHLQTEALKKVKLFLKKQNLDNPDLTGKIWQILNDNTPQSCIDYEQSQNFKNKWSQDLMCEL